MTVSPTVGDNIVRVIESKILGESAAEPPTLWCCLKWRPIVAEFIATVLLLLMGCMTTIPFEGQNSAMYAPFGFGLVVMFNIQIFGHISGAHMNPIITLAGIIWGNISVVLGIAYFCAHIAGALAGYGILTVLSASDVTSGGVCVTAPRSDINPYQALGIEIVITSALTFITCALWDPFYKYKQDSAPIKFGLTVAGLSMVGGPWTGAGMNPARSLAPAVFTGIWTVHWVYWLGPFIGSSVAAVIYNLLFLEMVTSTADTIVGVIENKMVPENTAPMKWSVSSWCSSNWRPIVSEFISTTMLLLMGCMGAMPFEGQNSAMYSPFGFGFVVMFNIQIFGHISGAHMNPAVTLAAIIWGSISVVLGIAYFAAQVGGALAGYGILMALSPIDMVAGGVCVTAPHHELDTLQAMGIETVLTAALSFINCALWDPVNKHKQDSAPIKFGLTIAGLSLVGGGWTGASMNPARTLAPAVYTGIWTIHWTYWVGPFVGSSLAALFYKYVFLKHNVSTVQW